MITTGDVYAHHRKQMRMCSSQIRSLRSECAAMKEEAELGKINQRCSERAGAADQAAQLRYYKAQVARQEKARAQAAEAKRVKAIQILILAAFLYIGAFIALFAVNYLQLADPTLIKFLINTCNWVACFTAGWFGSIVKN